MSYKPVNSSFIDGVSYDAATQAMTIHFTSGRTHTHEGVTAQQHKDLLAAESVGKHYNQNFKSTTGVKPVEKNWKA